jgi:hypothetical protein
MTNKLSEMTDQEIDSAMAEMMGWEMVQMTPTSKEYWGVCHFEPMIGLVGHEVIEIANWHPHDDLNQVWQCEEKIIKLGLVEKYSRIICGSVSVIQGKTMLFNIMHSTARQRCKAMLMTMMDHGNKVVHE